MGLSPRVRGNRRLCRLANRVDGPIPACAGEPRSCAGPWSGLWAYPRVCGGTGWTPLDVSAVEGLSPRVRGNRVDAPRCERGRGPIPACAGEPRGHPPVRLGEVAYPRVCGGTYASKPVEPYDGRLSPRVRGNPSCRHITSAGPRPIPACAGEPRSPRGASRSFRAYPRVCGGTRAYLEVVMALYGLSPRVRGNRCPPGARCGCRGPIPACAGEPSDSRMIRCPHRAYPRVCGGTVVGSVFNLDAMGLSPRVRGNHARGETRASGEGPIPACAGEPDPPL